MARLPLAVSLCALALAALAPAASASTDMQVGIADDGVTQRLPQLAPDTIRDWKNVGVEVTRVMAIWEYIAPAKESATAPEGFDPANPDDPAYDWAPLDQTIDLLLRRGIEPIVSITGPAPVWGSQFPARRNGRYKPDPAKFGQFATAVARRYSGRVNRFIIWNEPNLPNWLQPQFSCSGKRCKPASPAIYRELWKAAVPNVREAVPGASIYLGSTASRGDNPSSSNSSMRPLLWLRSLGCIGKSLRRDNSTAGCSTAGTISADGISYHPHTRVAPPSVRFKNPDEAGIADTGRLLRTVDAMQKAGTVENHAAPGQRFNLYYTEWGYQTNPPDPFSGVTFAEQSRWLQQGAYMAWRQPRVKLLVQYLWRDDPVRDKGQGPSAYSGWQSGLYLYDGRRKPSRETWPQPFWATLPKGSREAFLWGQVKPGGAHEVTIERKLGSGGYRALTKVATDGNGYFTLRTPVSGKASFRFTWTGSDTGGPDRRMVSSSVSLTRRR